MFLFPLMVMVRNWTALPDTIFKGSIFTLLIPADEIIMYRDFINATNSGPKLKIKLSSRKKPVDE